jgi:large subunit ribosomal protein L27
MAHKKGVGSSRNGRDSESKRLGVKRSDGSYINAGTIIVRQRGTEFWVGRNVGIGKDHTIYSKIEGVVRFEPIGRNKRRISVYPPDVYPVGGAKELLQPFTSSMLLPAAPAAAEEVVEPLATAAD